MLDLGKPTHASSLTSPIALVDLILKISLLITIICVFVPFAPAMPAAGLDSSWVLGMNQAVAQGISFGTDMIFTFGPYSSVYTKSYHPSTDVMMLCGSMYLALSYWICVVLLMKDVRWRWIMAFGIVLAGLTYSRDALLYSHALLAALVSYKVLTLEDGIPRTGSHLTIIVAILFAPLGFLPLIKGSLIILCVAITALSFVFFILKKERILAIVCVISPTLAIFLFWIASGQSIANLLNYLTASLEIISGYTEAMAYYGRITEILIYLIASAFLFTTIFLQQKLTKLSKSYLSCVFFVFLFLSFKAGFVRHDGGHAIAAATSILIAALLLSTISETKLTIPLLTLSVISCYGINMSYVEMSSTGIYNNFRSTYSSAWSGLRHRIEDSNWPRIDYDTAVKALRDQANFPVLQGTTDIYSYNQSFLFASGNDWFPRPVFQSYSVYTPALAAKNRDHLSGSKASDNVIFRAEPIDGRLPSIEDGASWPVLLTNYQPTKLVNDFLFLRKKTEVNRTTELSKLTSEKHIFGEVVNVPETGHPIFAEIEIKPTVWGRLANIFFKISELQVTFELKNDTRKQYRIISGMVKSGFVISPLIENTTEFGLLYAKSIYLDGKIVKTFSISPAGGMSSLWSVGYSVTFKEVQTNPQIINLDIYNIDRFSKELSDYKAATAEKCDGSIDSPAPARFPISGLLSLNGWVASSVDKSTLPEAVYVVLLGDPGNILYFKTRKTSRPDVGDYFKKPELNDSGFSVSADLSALAGKYTLGLAIKQSDGIKICPQFKIPITIAN